MQFQHCSLTLVRYLLTDMGLLAACVQAVEGISVEHTKFCVRGINIPNGGTRTWHLLFRNAHYSDDSIGCCLKNVVVFTILVVGDRGQR